MIKTQDLIREAESLPVEERVLIVDSLLHSLNAPEPERDRKWAEVAQRRLEELRARRVRGIPADEVFARIIERFGR